MSLYLGENLISGAQTTVSNSDRVGQIIQSLTPLTDAGLHLLDGSLVQGGGVYSAFVTYVASLVSTYPDLFETEANWQQSVTDYGVCGKFVYDSTNNTVRLPKITGIVEGTTDLTALGDLVQAGLPNITGDGTHYTTWSFPSGAIGSTGGSNHYSGDGNKLGQGIWDFDASRSSSIYGNSTTVQPQTIKVLYYIVIATSTKTDIQVDIDEIATDLNGKADTDLSNVPSSKGILTESYVNGTSWYRIYSDGWCEQGGYINSGVQAIQSGVTVSFLKEFTNTFYTITFLSSHSDTTNNAISIYYANSYYGSYYASSKATNQITICGQGTWCACGYIR